MLAGLASFLEIHKGVIRPRKICCLKLNNKVKVLSEVRRMKLLRFGKSVLIESLRETRLVLTTFCSDLLHTSKRNKLKIERLVFEQRKNTV